LAKELGLKRELGRDSYRYPTDVKILWESVDWTYYQLKRVVKSLKGRMPRSKYDKQNRRYHSYCKKRKHTQSETRVLKRSLLHLLNKNRQKSFGYIPN